MASLRPLVLAFIAVLTLALAPSAGAIVDGTPTTGADAPVVFVGQLTNPPRTACSGVAVSPTIVVTAAHCGLLTNGTAPAGQPFVVFKGPRVSAPSAPPALGIFVPHPAFMWGGDGVPHFADADLAVIRVVSGTVPGPYAALPAIGAVDALRGRTILDIYGYGVSELHGKTPIPSSFGTLRHANALLLGGGADREFLHFNGPACYGDSGGPVLYGNAVLGVISFTPQACRATNYATRLDTPSARAFLAQFGL